MKIKKSNHEDPSTQSGTLQKLEKAKKNKHTSTKMADRQNLPQVLLTMALRCQSKKINNLPPEIIVHILKLCYNQINADKIRESKLKYHPGTQLYQLLMSTESEFNKLFSVNHNFNSYARVVLNNSYKEQYEKRRVALKTDREILEENYDNYKDWKTFDQAISANFDARCAAFDAWYDNHYKDATITRINK